MRAYNERGWSSWSDANTAGAAVEVVPHKMTTVSRGATTTNHVLQVDWALPTGTATGGSDVTTFALYTDHATADRGVGETWSVLSDTISPTTTTYSFTASQHTLYPGNNYQFKIRATNYWGTGDFSDVTSVHAAITPMTTTNVQTVLDAATGGITVTWDEPGDIGGIPVATYTIECLGADGTWRTDPQCDGSDTTIRDARSCLIPMVNLAAPLGSTTHALVFQHMPGFRVKAANSYGDGPWSDVNTAGALIRQRPAAMPLPVEGSATNED